MATMIANKKEWYTFEDGAGDLDFIKAHENLEPLGKIHTPISSALVLSKFREKARSLGMELCMEKAALHKEGRRFMYTAAVRSETHLDATGEPEYTLEVGFRNFGDKSLAFSGMCASHVFVCENGVCHGIVIPSKMRHTSGNVGNGVLLDEKIDTIFSRFIEDKDAMHDQVGLMRSTPLTDTIVGQFVKGLVGNPYVGAANTMRIIEDVVKPELNDTNDSSVWRLANAASKVTTHHLKNPNHATMASRFCNNLIMSIIKPDFKPLGDAIDVEVVAA